MSEHSNDDEELEKFLSRDSALSRRYRESSDEQPPAHVDSAIIAASRWAVGADRTNADRTSADRVDADKVSADRTSTDRTGSNRIGADKIGVDRIGRGARHTVSSWRRSSMARWSVPLAMAAVVVLAVTVTITIERDPELDRINQRYDSPATAESEGFQKSAATDAAPSQAPPPVGESAAPGLTAQPGEPAPALPLAKREATTTLPPAARAPQAKEQIAREQLQQELAQQPTQTPMQQDRLAARKRSEAPQQGLATEQSIRRDAPATLAEEQAGQRAAPAPITAQPFPDGFSSETKATAQSDADASPLDQLASREDTTNFDETIRLDEARDESAVAGALTEPEQTSPAAVTAPGRQQALAPAPLAVPQSDQETAEQELDDRQMTESAQTTEIVAAEAPREPGQLREPMRWIEDIEELLAQGRRAEAIDSLEEFRIEYPDYELPPDLQALLPASGE